MVSFVSLSPGFKNAQHTKSAMQTIGDLSRISCFGKHHLVITDSDIPHNQPRGTRMQPTSKVVAILAHSF